MKLLTTGFALLLLASSAFAQQRIMKQGHRGCRGNMPENTIAAMKKAIDLGVDVLELDVVISKDKKVVVSHDTYMSSDFMLKPSGDTITAAESKSLLLYAMNYDEIKKYDAGSKPHPQFPEQQHFKTYKPLLSELIDSVDRYAKAKKLPLPFFNIEIKSQPKGDNTEHPSTQEFVDLVVNVCKTKGIISRMDIQSFDVRPLQLLHQQYPDILLSYLTANVKSIDDNLQTLGFTPAFYSPYYKTVNKAAVDTSHTKGMKIVPWTVNTKEEIKSLQDLGVDGIITDFPGLF
ncbi:MAG: glycerophosphodiester phosphodiesterase [Citrobacter freundii]|nr:MAG: glycerophosphodiester phosphodiesterase [Citrobacter freundii]